MILKKLLVFSMYFGLFKTEFIIIFLCQYSTVKESKGWCVNVNNGCRENFGERVHFIGYPNMTKEDCFESCMQTPEALGCEYGISYLNDERNCKVFSFPVSIGIENHDIYSYNYEGNSKSQLTCWSINRSKF